MCSSCNSFNHNANSCPYDISNACYANLNAVIETINERLVYFVDSMRERGLLPRTEPSPSSPRLEVSPYDDYEPSLPLEEVIDHPFVVPSLSSTPRDTIEGVLSLFSSPLHLAQCTMLEIGESLRGYANCVGDDLFHWSGEIGLLESSFEELYSDDVRAGAAPSIEYISPVCTESLNLVSISFPFLPTSPSHLHAFREFVGNIRGYNTSFTPYCAYLEEMPRKIDYTTFFDYSLYFSMAFDKCKRAFTFFAMILIVFSYLHHSEMHAQVHDKLLRVLTASELMTRVLSANEEWLMLLVPP